LLSDEKNGIIGEATPYAVAEKPVCSEDFSGVDGEDWKGKICADSQ
jgi:hypothetical protein